MSASNPVQLTKSAILPLTNNGLAYYLRLLPNLEVDYDFLISKATTHPVIPGNESFSIRFYKREWQHSYFHAGKLETGDVIGFCRLIKLNHELSESDVVRIISDELNLDLSGNDDSSASHDQKDRDRKSVV